MKAAKERLLFPALLFLLVLPLVADLPALQAGFTFDDLHSVSRNPHIRKLENIPRFFTDPTCFSSIPRNAMYRPVLLVSYALDFAAAGLSPWFWHLTNLLLHGVMGILVFLFLLRFLPRRGKAGGSGDGEPPWRGAAFAGAVLFLVHPLNVEVLGHVSSRSDLLMGVFLLGALLSAAKALEPGQKGGTLPFLCLSWVLLAGALLTKEPAVVFPAAAFPFLFFAQGMEVSRGEKFRRTVTALAPAVLLAAGYLVLRKHLLGVAAARLPAWTGGTDPLTGGGRDMVTQLATQAVALGKAVELLFFPVRLSADHWIPLQDSFFRGPVLLGFGTVLLFLLGVLWFSPSRRLSWAGLAWAGLLLAPSILVPLNQVFAEHRLYAAGPGLVLALVLAGKGLAAGLPALSRRAYPRWAGPALLVVVVLVLGTRSFLRCRDWRSREALWRATLATDPRSFRAWAQLGQVLGEKGDDQGALEAFRRARELYPENEGITVNLVEYLVRRATREGRADLCRQALSLAGTQVRRTPWKVMPRVKLCRSLLALSFLEKDRALARRGVEAAESILSFTAPLDRTFAIWAAALDTAGEGDAARVLWEWGSRILPGVGRKARLAWADLLIRQGDPSGARRALAPLLSGPADPEVRALVRRLRLSGTSPGDTSGSPGASPPRR